MTKVPHGRAFVALAAAPLLASAAPASAQVSGSVVLATDDRFRGVSMSHGEPVATAEVSYDTTSGAYLGASATVGLGQESAGLVNVSGNLGFALRLNPALSLDVGMVHSRYSEYGYAKGETHYTEVYLGAQARDFSAYVRYSPDYFQSGAATVYAEAATSVEPAPGWLVSAHTGLLIRVSGYAEGPDTTVDWSLGLTRRTGPIDIGLTLSASGGSTEYGFRREHAGTNLTASLRWNI